MIGVSRNPPELLITSTLITPDQFDLHHRPPKLSDKQQDRERVLVLRRPSREITDRRTDRPTPGSFGGSREGVVAAAATVFEGCAGNCGVRGGGGRLVAAGRLVR